MSPWQVSRVAFEWDAEKERENLRKHGVDFSTVPHAFDDAARLIIPDAGHSEEEPRFYCIGNDGAGYWRKQKQAYEKTNHH